MAREATDGLYIELDYYTPENYHTYTAEASMISGEYIDNGYIDIDYFQPGVGTGLFALTCDLTEVVGELKEFAGALSVVASTAPSAVKTVVVDTSLTVTATQSSTVGVIKQGAVALTGAFSPSINAVAILRPDVFLESSVSFAATAVKTTSNEVILSYLASLDAQAARTRAYDSALSASFDTSTTANSTKPFSAALQSTFTIPSIDTDGFKSVSANLSTTSTLSITGKTLCERPLRPDVNTVPYSTFGGLGPAFGSYAGVTYHSNGNGILEYILCQDAMPDNTTEWFAEGWVGKTTNQQETTHFSLMYDEDKTSNNKEIFFFGEVNGNRTSISVRNDTATSNEVDTLDGAVDNTWKHFVFGWKPSEGAKLWLDGSVHFTEDDITSVTVRNNKFGRLLFGRKYVGDTNNDSISWMDEFRIVKGVGVLDKYGYDWDSTSITEPTSAFTDTTDTKLLLHWENNDTDDFIPGLAQASISATATVAVDVERIQLGASGINSQFSLTADAQSIKEVTVALDSAATVDATIGSIKTFEAALTNAFTPSITVDAIKNAFAILDTNTTLSADVDRVKGIVTQLSSAFSVTVDAIIPDLATAAISSAFTLSADANFTADPSNTITAVASAEATIKRKDPHWIVQSTTDTDDFELSSANVVAPNDDGSAYAIFRFEDPDFESTDGLYIIKYDKYGAAEWKYRLEYNMLNAATTGLDAVTNSNGQLLLTFNLFEVTSSPRSFVNQTTVKIDSDGDFLNQSTFGFDGRQDTLSKIHVDANDNYYVVGLGNQTDASSDLGGTITKWNASGSYQWKKFIEDIFEISDLTTDASGNIYIVGGRSRVTADNELLVAKLNSTATTFSWQKYLDSGDTTIGGGGNAYIFFDNAGDLIVTANYTDASGPTQYNIIAKFETDGTPVWQKTTNYLLENPTIDERGNLYAHYGTTTFGKITPEYVVDKERTITQENVTPDVEFGFESLHTNAQSDVFLTGFENTNGTAITVKIDLEFNQPGYYGTETDNEIFNIETDSKLTISSANLTFNNASYTITDWTTASDNIIRDYFEEETDPISSELFVNLNLIQGSAFLDAAQATVSCTISKTTRITANVAVNTTVVCDPTLIANAICALDSAFTTNIDYIRYRDTSSNLNTQFAIVVDNVRAKLFEPSLSSAFTLPDVAYDFFRGLAISAEAEATVEAEPLRIKQLGASLTGAFSPSIDAVAILRPDVFLEVEANIATDAVIFAGAQSTNNQVTTTLVCDAVKTTDVTQDLSSAFAINANIFSIIQFESALTVAVTSDITFIRNRFASSALDLSVTTQITPNRQRNLIIQLNTAVSLQAAPQLLVEAGADITAQFEDTFVVTRLRKAEADLSVFGFSVTVGDIINIDPFRQLIVPSETRFIKVSQETRRVVVPSETRILEV